MKSIVEEYIEEFDKDFTDMIPVCDLADLLFYMVYAIKVKGESFEGFDYLLTYKTPGMIEVDQHAVTNALAYIQKIKGCAPLRRSFYKIYRPIILLKAR